jgi:anti-sigma factor RsiW
LRHPDADLSAYVDGALTPEEATRIAAHLATCPACRAVAEDLRAVRSLVRSVPEPEPDPGALARTLRHVEDSRIHRRSGWGAVWVAAAAAGLALLLQLPWVPVPRSDAAEEAVQLRYHARVTLAHPMAEVAVATFLSSALPSRLAETEWEP